MKKIFSIIVIIQFISFNIQSNPEPYPVKAAPLPLIIDADTANEIDDLYAIVRALLAPELDVRGITSAHFTNSPLASENSVEESQILNEEILKLMDRDDIPLYLGSNYPLENEDEPQESDAARFIIEQAHLMKDGERLHIVVLGPCTNVASAILMDSSIIEKVEISYIGFWHDIEKMTWSRLEFNTGNDVKSVNVLLTTPNIKFNSMTATTSGNLKFDKRVAKNHLYKRGGIKDHLYNRWLDHKRWWSNEDPKKNQWTMWDVAIIEALIHPENATSEMLIGPKPNNGIPINVYTDINVDAMKASFWEAINMVRDEPYESYVITDISIVSPSSGDIFPQKNVYVSNGIITKIESSNNHDADVSHAASIINGEGKYLMPGLSEMHAHLPVPNEELGEDHAEDVMLLYLANGVTVIRGMLGNPYHLELKKKVRNGEILGPRIYSSSPSMNGNNLPDAKTAETRVREYKAAGYDFLKIHPGIKSNVMLALVKEANKVSIPFSGHVPFEVGIDGAIRYGYSTVDHLDGYIRGLVPPEIKITNEDVGFFGYGLIDKVRMNRRYDLAEATKDNNVWVVPTQTLFTRWLSPLSAAEMMRAHEFNFMPAKTRYAWRTSKDRLVSDDSYSKKDYKKFIKIRKKIVQSLHENGVPFLLGSDSPQVMNVPGFSIHHEIDAMRECGLSSHDIIKSGTTNPSIFFDEIDTFGTIQEGAEADFIIVSDNPFDRLSTMRYPVGTMIQGKWLERPYFLEQLERIANKHKVEEIGTNTP